MKEEEEKEEKVVNRFGQSFTKEEKEKYEKEKGEKRKAKESGEKNRKSKNDRKLPKAEYIAWHEGAHLISKCPDSSPTYQMVLKKMLTYYNIDTTMPYGTRFNWYVDCSDWKPFHHDSAAFNEFRAKSQNITITASFGCERELAFIHSKALENEGGRKVRVYVPNTNGMLISFGRDANINWKVRTTTRNILLPKVNITTNPTQLLTQPPTPIRE